MALRWSVPGTSSSRLLNCIAADDGGLSNLIFSLLSIHVGLMLMSFGACGASLEEILGVVSAPLRDELAAFVGRMVVKRTLADRSGPGGPRIVVACGAWSDATWPLKPAYRDTVVGTFKANTWTVDFKNNPVEARKQINVWVAEATRDSYHRGH